MDTLQRASELIKSGQKKEGGELLIELLKDEPQNEQAWLWLAAAVRGREKKKECLNRVLTINPENAQARKLLATLEEIPSPPPEDESIPPAFGEAGEEDRSVQESPDRESAGDRVSPFSDETDPEEFTREPFGPEEDEDSTPSFLEDPAGADGGESGSTEPDSPAAEEEPYQPPTYLDQPDEGAVGTSGKHTPDPDPAEHTFGEIARNWTRVFSMSGEFFQREIRYANGGDTLLSVLVHTILTVVFFLISGTMQFRAVFTTLQSELAAIGQVPNLGALFVGLLVGSVIFTPISFYLTAGLQYLGSRLFGGKGTYIQQAYLQSLIQVPVTLLGGLLSLGALIPGLQCVLGPVGLILSIWALILTVRALKAVHDLTTGRAVLAMIVPPILLMFLFGCILVVTGSAIGSIFQSLINQQMPVP